MILKFNDEMQAIILNKELAEKLKEQERQAKKKEEEFLNILKNEIQTNHHSMQDK